MAKLLFIDDYKSVQELVNDLQGHAIVVLASKKLFEEHEIDERMVRGYSCGGEADVILDVVTSPSHYFFSHLKESQHG